MEDRIKELEQLANRLNAECVEATEILQALITGVDAQRDTAAGVCPELGQAAMAADRFLRGEESGATRINEVLDAVRKALGRPGLMMTEMAAAVRKQNATMETREENILEKLLEQYPEAGAMVRKALAELPEAEETRCDCLEAFAEGMRTRRPECTKAFFQHTSAEGRPLIAILVEMKRRGRNVPEFCYTQLSMVKALYCPFCGKYIPEKTIVSKTTEGAN